ncbi:MAG: putative porin, partial [Elusimicrobia bacterium]|nr:putative porin [Elusimicrobiota bacterium]
KAGDVTTILRLASGTGSQTSANQTEQSQFSQKGVWIDLAEMRYKANDMLTVEGGRMNNPFWSSWESSLVWDPDLNPEGYAEEVSLPMGLFAKAGQFPINESASYANAGPWMFAHQLGVKTEVPGGLKASFAFEDNVFTNVDRHPMGELQTNYGNTAASGLLTSKFNVVHLWGALEGSAMDLPVALRVGYVDNTSENTGHARSGFIGGAEVGKASKAGSWEAAYYYKYLGANATLANQVDDDFGPGGTNLAGHLLWAAYAPRDNVQLKLSFYDTRVIDTSLLSASRSSYTSQRYMGHVMADIMVKI